MGKQQQAEGSAPVLQAQPPAAGGYKTTLVSHHPYITSFLKRDTQVFLILRLGWGWKRTQGVLSGEVCAATCLQPAGCKANPLPFSSLSLVVSDEAEWNKVFWRSCELQLRFAEASKPSSEVYLKRKVPWN